MTQSLAQRWRYHGVCGLSEGNDEGIEAKIFPGPMSPLKRLSTSNVHCTMVEQTYPPLNLRLDSSSTRPASVDSRASSVSVTLTPPYHTYDLKRPPSRRRKCLLGMSGRTDALTGTLQATGPSHRGLIASRCAQSAHTRFRTEKHSEHESTDFDGICRRLVWLS